MKADKGNRVSSIKKVILDNFKPFQEELARCDAQGEEYRAAIEKRWNVEISLKESGISYELPKKYEAVNIWGSKEEVERYQKNGCVLSGDELLIHINLMESWQSISEKLKKIYEEKTLGTFVLKEKEISFEDIAKVFSDYYSYSKVDLGELLKKRLKSKTRPSQLKKEFLNKIFELEMLIDPHLKILVRGKRQLTSIEDTCESDTYAKPRKQREI